MTNATENWAVFSPKTGKVAVAYTSQASAVLYRSYQDKPHDWIVMPHGFIADHLLEAWRKA